MPPKKDTSKATLKNADEKETPFDPVPYETRDVCTSISLLLSPEKDVVTRAVWVLAKYASTNATNSEFLYKNGILTNLVELINYSDLTILRFTLKLLGQIIWDVPNAARDFSLEQYNPQVKQISHIFITVQDPSITEFSTQILSRVVKDPLMASYLFRAGVVVSIFQVLQTSKDADIQFNTLNFFYDVLQAREAKHVLPLTAEFSARTLLCYLKSKLEEIRETALNILERITLWKSSPMQQLLRDQQVVEVLLKIILNPKFKALHKKAFNIIHTCMECLNTASYFVKSLEFIQFCQWATKCPKKCILPSAIILTKLSKFIELRQLLFDFSVEDTILSFFRINNELVFYKTCEAISNMSSHRYCCEKMITPVVIQCLLQMLTRNDVPIIPYHEIAIKTLYDLLKKDGRTLKLIIACRGIPLFTTCWLRDKKEYTHETLSILMEMLYIFSSDAEFRKITMNSRIYEMLLNTFDDSSDFSNKALLVLNQYVDDRECRQYFIEFGGPKIVLKQISSTPSEKTLKDILIFLQRIFLYKKVGMAFLLAGCLSILKSICDEVKQAIPLIDQLISMMYDLYLPIKFHELGRLDITDHFTSRFYLINGCLCTNYFPFLEILTEQQACPIDVVYIVDFTANPEELIRTPIRSPPSPEATPPSPTSIQTNNSRKSGSRSKRRSSILKSTSASKTQRVSIQLNGSFVEVASNEGRQVPEGNLLTCQVPPPINYGCISEDPYLPNYVEKLKSLLFNNKKYILCFQHQVKLIAHFVSDVLSGPDGISNPLDPHCLDVHLTALKDKLGTNLIPIGYLRCGSYCERALLFKALAEKVGVPCTLVRGQNRMFYWNEVPIMNEEPYAKAEDEQRTYLSYAVVNLIDKVGELMLVESVEASKYCGLYVDTNRIKIPLKSIQVKS